MRLSRVATALLVACASVVQARSLDDTLTATTPQLVRHVQRILSTQADDTSACDAAFKTNPFASYLTALPETAGIRNCAAANIQTLMAPLTAQGAKCSLTTLTGLFSSGNNAGLSVFTEFFNALVSGITPTTGSGAATSASLQATLSSWTAASSTKNAAFCTAMNTQIGPCVESLLPTLVTILQNEGKCCSQLAEFFELAKLLVPEGKTLDQALVAVVNGLHLAMCTTTGNGESTGYCGQSLLSYLGDVVKETGDKSLLSPLLFSAGLPLFALPDGAAACSALDATTFPSRVAGSGGAYAYTSLSCCASGLASLIESVDVMIEHLTGSSLAETLNFIAGIQDATAQFKAPYATLSSCSSSKTTCSKPSFVLTPSTTTPVVQATTTAQSKNARPQQIKCTTEELCDKNKKVCSTVCKQGTVQVAPWVARAVSFQRNLSYAQPLCFTQLPATHNSATTLARGWGNRDQLINKALDANNSDSFMRTNNQFVSVTDQLQLGARLVEIDVHYYGKQIRDGHCSRVNFALLDDASAAIKRTTEALLSAGTETKTVVEWQSSLMGCLPSLGGIRADEARAHAETVTEMATWLTANPNEMLFVYLELGSELTTFNKMDELLSLHKKAFGDLLLTPAELMKTGGSWSTLPLRDLVKTGKRVALMTFSPPETAQDVLFDMRTLCKGGWADSLAGGVTTNTGKLVRVFSSALHYATMSESSLQGATSGNKSAAVVADRLDVSTMASFVNAGVNFVAADGLDGAVMQAMVWSWAEKQPSAGSTAVAISAKDGRWYGVVDKATSIPNVACVASSDRMSWKIVAQGTSCSEGFAVGAPRLAVENVALTKALKAIGADATAQLSVDLTAIPVISAQDEAAFEGAMNGGGGGAGGGQAGGSTDLKSGAESSSTLSAVVGALTLLVVLTVQ